MVLEHPRIVAALGGIAALIAVVSGLYGGAAWVDDRYAHAAAVNAQQAALTRALEINRLSGELAALGLRRQTLQDRIYDLSSRPGARPPHEAAALQRYSADLDSVGRDIRAKERLIESLRTGVR